MSTHDEVVAAINTLLDQIPNLDPLSEVNPSPLWSVLKDVGVKLGIPDIGSVGASDVMSEIYWQMEENNAFTEDCGSGGFGDEHETARRKDIWRAMSDDSIRQMRDYAHEYVLERGVAGRNEVTEVVAEAMDEFMEKPDGPFRKDQPK